jgi:hypothetical protein
MHLPVAGTTADADRGCFARLGQYLLEAVVVARFLGPPVIFRATTDLFAGGLPAAVDDADAIVD